MNADLFEGLDISSDLMEQAIAATSPDELLSLARDAGIELTDEQLEDIAGGDAWDTPGDTRDDIDEAQVSEAFRMGLDLGDEAE